MRDRILLLLLGSAGAGGCAGAPLQRHEYVAPHMGTEFRLVLYCADRTQADAAAAAAEERIAELERELTDYDPESELSRLGQCSDGPVPTAPIPVSDDLFRVLERAQEVAGASGGAFDATVGPYVRLWRRARRQEELPSVEHLRAASRSVGFLHLELDQSAGTVRLLAPAMRLDLGGIAKGFALDEALAVLAQHGISRALVDGGGDVAVGAPPPGRSGWRIELAGLGQPGETIELARASVATSGDLERYLELGGRRYSHIIDPRTGQALEERRLVSVIAANGMLADALATAVSVLGVPDGLELAQRFPGAQTRVVIRRGGAGEVFRTRGFPESYPAGQFESPSRSHP